MIGIERLYLKGVVGMGEKIEIKKQDFYGMMYLMEKILYIAERAGAAIASKKHESLFR